jgi:hypothetical protein
LKIDDRPQYDFIENSLAVLEKNVNNADTDNYTYMKERIGKLPTDDHVDGSSNFSKLVQCLESDDVKWIDRINDSIEA